VQLESLVAQLCVQLPMVLVLVAGVVLIILRGVRVSGRARSLAIAGIGMLLLNVLMSAAWALAIPWILEHNRLASNEFNPISIGVGTLLSAWRAAGVGLLIGAALFRGGRPAAVTPAAGWPSAPPPATGPQEPGPQGMNQPGADAGGYPAGTYPPQPPAQSSWTPPQPPGQ
jgi:hypothetical protein